MRALRQWLSPGARSGQAAITSYRPAAAGIKVRQPLASLSIKHQASSIKRNKELLDILKEEVNVKEIIFDSKIKGEIELDIQITAELKREGVLRELTRLIQGLRRDAGYQPMDKIILMIEGPADLNTVLERNKDFLKKEINAQDIELKSSAKFDAELNTRIDDWQIWLGIRRI